MPNNNMPELPSPSQWKNMTAEQQKGWLQDYGKAAGLAGGDATVMLGSSAQLNSMVLSYKGGDSSAAIDELQKSTSEGQKSKKQVDANAAALANAASSGQKPQLSGTADEQNRAKDQAATQIAGADKGSTKYEQARAALDALTNNVPDWVLAITGGKTPTSAQKQKIIDTYNAFFTGTSPLDANVKDTDLWTTLDKAQNGDFQKTVDNAINSQQQPGKQYLFPSGDSFFLSGDRQASAIKTYAADQNTIDLAVQMAHSLGLTTDGAGPQNTMWQPILALATALGQTGAVVTPEATTKAAEKNRKRTTRGPNPDTEDFPVGLEIEGMAQRQLQGGMSVYDAAKKFQANLTAYNGDRGLALLGTFDKALADRFLANGRKFLDPNDVVKAAQIFTDTKWGQISDVGLATEKDANVVEALLQGDVSGAFGKGGSTSSGRTIVLPDPEKVKQSAKDMWRALFLTEAPDQWVNQQLENINSLTVGRQQTDTDPKTNNVVGDTDIPAQLLAALRESPLYQTLYGHKQPGQTEEQYAGQFQAGAASMLGNESPDVAALQAGMQTGDYQTTVGAIAGSSRSQGNSTFMERLARAAQAVNAYT